jgi:hypothetical protein
MISSLVAMSFSQKSADGYVMKRRALPLQDES